MKNFFKSKLATAIVLITTVVLAGIAIFTAMKLYQLRQASVAPNAPESIPHAEGASPAPVACSLLTFTIGVSTSTPTPTPGPKCNDTCTTNADCPSEFPCTTVSVDGASEKHCRKTSCSEESDCVCPGSSPTATPTSTPKPTNTPGPTSTPTPGGQNGCNGTCGSNDNCGSGYYCYQGFCRVPDCPNSTNCSCSGATATPQASLPVAGTNWPSVLGIGFGTLILIGAFLLAL